MDDVDDDDNSSLLFGNLAFSSTPDPSLKNVLMKQKPYGRSSWVSQNNSQHTSYRSSSNGSQNSSSVPRSSSAPTNNGPSQNSDFLRKRLRELEDSIEKLREIKKQQTGESPLTTTTPRNPSQSSSQPRLRQPTNNVGSQYNSSQSQHSQRRVPQFRPPAPLAHNRSQASHVFSDISNQPRNQTLYTSHKQHETARGSKTSIHGSSQISNAFRNASQGSNTSHTSASQTVIDASRGNSSRSGREGYSQRQNVQCHRNSQVSNTNSQLNKRGASQHTVGTSSHQSQANLNRATRQSDENQNGVTLKSYFSPNTSNTTLPPGAAVSTFNLVSNLVPPPARSRERGSSPLHNSILLNVAENLQASQHNPFNSDNNQDGIAPSERFRSDTASVSCSRLVSKPVPLPGPVGALSRSHTLFNNHEDDAPVGTQAFREIVKQAELKPMTLDFAQGPWLSLCLSNRLPPAVPSTLLDTNPLLGTNIAKLRDGEACKVPFLCVLITEIHFLEVGATVSLADPTGTIEAEVSQEVLKSDEFEFLPEAAVVLRNTTLFQPHFKKLGQASHYLIVTMQNIDQVFSPDTPVPTELVPRLASLRQSLQDMQLGRSLSVPVLETVNETEDSYSVNSASSQGVESQGSTRSTFPSTSARKKPAKKNFDSNSPIRTSEQFQCALPTNTKQPPPQQQRYVSSDVPQSHHFRNGIGTVESVVPKQTRLAGSESVQPTVTRVASSGGRVQSVQSTVTRVAGRGGGVQSIQSTVTRVAGSGGRVQSVQSTVTGSEGVQSTVSRVAGNETLNIVYRQHLGETPAGNTPTKSNRAKVVCHTEIPIDDFTVDDLFALDDPSEMDPKCQVPSGIANQMSISKESDNGSQLKTTNNQRGFSTATSPAPKSNKLLPTDKLDSHASLVPLETSPNRTGLPTSSSKVNLESQIIPKESPIVNVTRPADATSASPNFVKSTNTLQSETRTDALQSETRTDDLQSETRTDALQSETRTDALQSETRTAALQSETRTDALQSETRSGALHSEAPTKTLDTETSKVRKEVGENLTSSITETILSQTSVKPDEHDYNNVSWLDDL